MSHSHMFYSIKAELHGLRSIPYMVFSGTGVTDSAALFLSYILPAHPTPEKLMKFLPPPKPGAPSEILESYYSLGCRGIIYRPNDRLSPLSKRVLECAEGLREGKPVTVVLPDPSPFKPGIKHYEAPFSPRRRRHSVSFVLGGNSPASSVPDLERARSKIQGSILKEAGAHAVALWSAALKVLVVARQIAFDPAAGPYEGHKRSFGRHAAASASPLFIQRNPHSHSHSPPTSPTRRHSALSPLPSSSLFDAVSCSPSAESDDSFPHLESHSPYRSPRHSPVGPATTLPASTTTTTTTTTPLPAASPTTNAAASQATTAASSPATATATAATEPTTKGSNGRTVAEPRLPGDLPEALWKKIIGMAVDPDGLLSSKQISNLVDWAKTPDTLEKERELSGKLKSLQIWRILEGTECLAYDDEGF